MQVPLERLLQTAQAEWPGYQLNYIYFPTDEDPAIYFYGSNHASNTFHSPYGSWLGIDSQSGEITIASDLREAGLWANILDTFEPLHFGGIVSKILWCLAGLAPGILAISGSLIFFSRKAALRRRS